MDCRRWAVDEDRCRIRWPVDDDRRRRRWAVDCEEDDHPPLQWRDPPPHYPHKDRRQSRRASDDGRRREALRVMQLNASLDRMIDSCSRFIHSLDQKLSSASIPTSSPPILFSAPTRLADPAPTSHDQTKAHTRPASRTPNAASASSCNPTQIHMPPTCTILVSPPDSPPSPTLQRDLALELVEQPHACIRHAFIAPNRISDASSNLAHPPARARSGPLRSRETDADGDQTPNGYTSSTPSLSPAKLPNPHVIIPVSDIKPDSVAAVHHPAQFSLPDPASSGDDDSAPHTPFHPHHTLSDGILQHPIFQSVHESSSTCDTVELDLLPLCIDHSINASGRYQGDTNLQLEQINVYNNKANCGHFAPRAILMDAEPDVKDILRSDTYGARGIFLGGADISSSPLDWSQSLLTSNGRAESYISHSILEETMIDIKDPSGITIKEFRLKAEDCSRVTGEFRLMSSSSLFFDSQLITNFQSQVFQKYSDINPPQFTRISNFWDAFDAAMNEMRTGFCSSNHVLLKLFDLKTACCNDQVVMSIEAAKEILKFGRAQTKKQFAYLKHPQVCIDAIEVDSHNTINNGLGIVAWGIGGIEVDDIMLGVALVAKKTSELDLEVNPWIQTSLTPGVGIVTKYLLKSGSQQYLNQQGSHDVGYGYTTLSKLDLHSGYYQVQFSRVVEWKMVFTTHHSLYKWKVMSFRLCKRHPPFKRLMNKFMGIHCRRKVFDPGGLIQSLHLAPSL